MNDDDLNSLKVSFYLLYGVPPTPYLMSRREMSLLEPRFTNPRPCEYVYQYEKYQQDKESDKASNNCVIALNSVTRA